MKVIKNKSGRYWTVYFQGYAVGCWRTPKQARHKARMYHMWITTGDETYLRKEM